LTGYEYWIRSKSGNQLIHGCHGAGGLIANRGVTPARYR